MACFRDSIARHPKDPQPRFQVALTLIRQNKIAEAIIELQSCSMFAPKAPEPFFELGILFGKLNRLEESTTAFRRASELRPESADYCYNLGYALVRQQIHEEAITHLLRASEMRRDHAPTWLQLGIAAIELNRFDDALGRLNEAVRLCPDHADTWFHLGVAQRRLRRYDEALESYQRVLHIEPNHCGAPLNIGIMHTERGQFDQAIAVLRDLHGKQPKLGEACNCLAIAYLHQGHAADAFVWFDKAIDRQPNNGEFHLNRSLCLLLLGDYVRGRAAYEARWQVKRSTACPVKLPPWDGSPMPNGSIVLWFEQGLGDTIQFLRFAAQVKERVGKVILVCPTPLRALAASCPGIDEIIGDGSPHPNADVQVPLLSLPRLLGTTVETIPNSGPYLFVDDSLRDKWRDRITASGKLKVGIVWQGNPHYTGDRYRSVALEQFRPLAQVPGVQLFSLQKNHGCEQLADLAGEMNIIDLASHISGDFLDTAAAMVNLDLVVSVDSSVAHLAGALGKPVWILLPFNNDWRWLQHRGDSPWYPSARLFRNFAKGRQQHSDLLSRFSACRCANPHVVVNSPG
jgi:tetratricopeptide (TPR) repeat protein